MRSVHTASTPDDLREEPLIVPSVEEIQETQREEDIADAVAALLDITVVGHHNSPIGETFIECKMCGEWDNHKGHCPVPSLEQWLNPR